MPTCSSTWATATAGRASTRRSRRTPRTASGSIPTTGRRRHEDRLLRRGVHPEQHPARTQRRRAPVPPLLRLGQHRARPRDGVVRRLPPARRQLRGRVHRRRRPGGLRRGPPRAPGHELHPAAVHDQPDDGPGLPVGAHAATATSSGPYASQRTPGLRFELDPDTAAPSGFYRSLVGDLGLTAADGHRATLRSTGDAPGRLRGPRCGRGRGRGRRRAVRHCGSAADPAADPAATRWPRATRLRLTAEAAPVPDGTRILAVTVLGGDDDRLRARRLPSLRATARPTGRLECRRERRDALAQRRRNQVDALVVTTRFSETGRGRRSSSRTRAGTTVKTMSITNDIVRYAWNLRDGCGQRDPQRDVHLDAQGQGQLGQPWRHPDG